jgi:hypothetical protein
MSVSFVAATSAEATSLTLPTHQAGDLLAVAGWRNSNSIIGVPSGWFTGAATRAGVGGLTTIVVGWKIASSASEVSGTWTDAALLVSVVYRHSTNHIVLRAANAVSATSSSNINWPGIVTFDSAPAAGDPSARMSVSSGWLFRVGGSLSNASSIATAPIDATNRVNIKGTSANELTWHDSNAGVGSFTARTSAIGLTSNQLALAGEILDTGIPKSSGSAPQPRIVSPYLAGNT